MDAEQFKRSIEALGINLTDEQLKQFQRFEDALYEANKVMNLTRVPQEECWRRHFLDSLLFHDLISPFATVLDLGTGPGFPAWPLACARPDLAITALDSNSKMLSFLQGIFLPNLSVVKARAEEWNERESFDFVTGRAVAPLSAQLEISAAFCKIGGRVVPMRAASDSEAIQAVNCRPLGLRSVRVEERPLPGTDVIRLFPIYEKFQSTQSGYPRRWAELKRKPL
jgi:16S rRNA (guanine527-N7)-methyltransferase